MNRKLLNAIDALGEKLELKKEAARAQAAAEAARIAARNLDQPAIFDLPTAPPKLSPKSNLPQLPIAEDAVSKPCMFCGVTLYQGYTELGNRTWLEPVGSGDHGTNHFILCKKQDEAKAYFSKQRRKR